MSENKRRQFTRIQDCMGWKMAGRRQCTPTGFAGIPAGRLGCRGVLTGKVHCPSAFPWRLMISAFTLTSQARDAGMEQKGKKCGNLTQQGFLLGINVGKGGMQERPVGIFPGSIKRARQSGEAVRFRHRRSAGSQRTFDHDFAQDRIQNARRFQGLYESQRLGPRADISWGA